MTRTRPMPRGIFALCCYVREHVGYWPRVRAIGLRPACGAQVFGGVAERYARYLRSRKAERTTR